MELVLDTNIYRNLIRGLNNRQIKILEDKIIEGCDSKNITILFPINSAMELISHLNDKNDNDRKECDAAIKLLINLSTKISEGEITVDFIPPINSILANYFFGKEEDYTKMYGVVITLAQKIGGNYPVKAEDNIDKDIETVKNQISFEKEEIRSNYEEYLKSINNGEADWNFFKDKKNLRRDYFEKLRIGKLSFLVAQSFVDRAYNIAGQKIDKDQTYFDLVVKFMQDFCPALLMNEKLLENIGNSVEAIKDIKDPRWNTIIDISLILGSLFNLKNIDKKLVTEEKNIIGAFENCNYRTKILNLDEFRNLIGI